MTQVFVEQHQLYQSVKKVCVTELVSIKCSTKPMVVNVQQIDLNSPIESVYC